MRKLDAILRPVFALDLRSLAAFRIGIAAILLIDILCRLQDVPAFLTDDGVLPRTLRMEMAVENDPAGYDYQWSLHLLSGHAWAQYVLLAVAGWFAGWLLVGYHTRVAAVISWVLLVSLGNRNPLIYDAGDAVLRIMIFWSLFLPLGARFSLDARRLKRQGTDKSSGNQAANASVVSFGSAAFILQLLVVYFSAAIFKMNPVWLREFSGVYYALNCDPFATSFGLVVRDYPTVMKILTASTILLELCGPIIVLLSCWNRWIRLFIVMAFSALHVGMAAMMTLGLFPWICICAWLALLPDIVWNRWGTKIRQQWDRRWRWDAEFAQVKNDRPEIARPQVVNSVDRLIRFGKTMAQVTLHVVAAALLVYAVLWNTRDVVDAKTAQRILPDRMNRLAQALGLEKGWRMFAPVPRRDDGWPIFKGILRDGSEVNLWQPDQPIPYSKPKLVSAMYVNQRWRRFLENMTMEGYTMYRPYFADWLQKRWNRKYAGRSPAREVVTVEILRQLETTPPPGEPIPKPEITELWTKHYGQSVEGMAQEEVSGEW